MAEAATTAVPAGSRVTLELAGSVPVWLTDAAFRESFGNQLRMQGLNVETISISSGYGVSSRDYVATVIVSTLTPSKVSAVAAQVLSAAEGAGSYTPQVTVPSVGQASQPALPKGAVDGAIGDVVDAVTTALKNIADAPKDVVNVGKLVVIGIVVIAVVVAFGPNLRGIGRNVSIG